MNIEQIAYRMNTIAEDEGHSFGAIQLIRKKYYGRVGSYAPFAKKTIKLKEGYAYHHGGRKELQFNIGDDGEENEPIFRYGVAFSLQQDNTVHSPLAEFKPLVNRFNDWIKSNPGFFEGFSMWYYARKDYQREFKSVREISGNLFQAENFIFIGKYFNKPIDEIGEDDIRTMIATFDYLMPLYEKVQFDQFALEKRVARICWNDKEWKEPSGRAGKSTASGTHEYIHGYGHEEWIFDLRKEIDGYCYGFLEPIRKHQETYAGRYFWVWLYTINSETSQRYWVGIINKIQVLNSAEANHIFKEYQKNKWDEEMEKQIIACGANDSGFSNWSGLDIINIKFQPKDLVLNEDNIEIPLSNPLVNIPRYNFTVYKDEFAVAEDSESPFVFEHSLSDDRGKDTINQRLRTKVYQQSSKNIEITFLHKQISELLLKLLKARFGKDAVAREHPAGYGSHRIDMVVKNKNEIIFYEIKTYPSLKSSIREAVGQLMEYCMWTHHKRADKLIIVSHLPITQAARKYFVHLRRVFPVPIFYQHFDLDTSSLSEEY